MIRINGLAAFDSQPLLKPPAIKDLPIYQTGSGVISDARTVGTASTQCSTAYIGNFERLFYVSRLKFNIQVLREKYSENWQIGLLAALRDNFKPTHENAFVKLTGILPEDSVLT
ncbi:MAG: phage major capsid protein [Cyclobacteriaceae bacterium]|nr:phage major capsid protein [Cyclobacteriaceae bacterium]